VTVYELNPLTDLRWQEFISRQPNATAFHTPGWMRALAETYRYEPFVLTTTPPDCPIENGIPFCQVTSWLTGKRLVSLPFADHCDPLCSSPDSLEAFERWIKANIEEREWKYVECRPISASPRHYPGFHRGRTYYFHSLDLRPGAKHIFSKMHKNCIQRMVRRAEREKLSYEVGRSAALMDDFYQLLVMTRRRLGLVPQPRCWFDNLVKFLGQAVEIRLARRDNQPVAAVLSLQHRNIAIYKYGCSDAKFHHLGSMPFLFWRLIEDCCAAGVTEIDLGRSDVDNPGLISFKDRLGASIKSFSYFRYLPSDRANVVSLVPTKTVKLISSMLPDYVLELAGRVLYRHMG
jgi:hypothetical protein